MEELVYLHIKEREEDKDGNCISGADKHDIDTSTCVKTTEDKMLKHNSLLRTQQLNSLRTDVVVKKDGNVIEGCEIIPNYEFVSSEDIKARELLPEKEIPTRR